MADISHGWTIAFGTSGWAPDITDIKPPGMSREAFDTSHQGTDTYRTFMADDLVDCGSLEISGHYDMSDDPPGEEAEETITLTDPAGNTAVFTGFVTDFQPDAPHGQIMTFSATIKVNGSVLINPAGSGSGTFYM